MESNLITCISSVLHSEFHLCLVIDLLSPFLSSPVFSLFISLHSIPSLSSLFLFKGPLVVSPSLLIGVPPSLLSSNNILLSVLFCSSIVASLETCLSIILAVLSLVLLGSLFPSVIVGSLVSRSLVSLMVSVHTVVLVVDGLVLLINTLSSLTADGSLMLLMSFFLLSFSPVAVAVGGGGLKNYHN